MMSMTHNGAKLWRRIWNSFAPATITQANDAGPVMTLQVQLNYLETFDDIPCPQQFGFASVPPIGAEAAVMFVGGDRSNGAAVATNDPATRFTNKAKGESVVFNAFGMSIYLSAAGITINAGDLPVILNGTLLVTGEVMRGYGTPDAVTLGEHRHGTGSVAAGTVSPTPGT